jgi:hypothetical protein
VLMAVAAQSYLFIAEILIYHRCALRP